MLRLWLFVRRSYRKTTPEEVDTNDDSSLDAKVVHLKRRKSLDVVWGQQKLSEAPGCEALVGEQMATPVKKLAKFVSTEWQVTCLLLFLPQKETIQKQIVRQDSLDSKKGTNTSHP